MSEPTVHTSLHRAELLVGDSLDPGDALRLSSRQLEELRDGLAEYLRTEGSLPRSPGLRVAVSERYRGRVDHLAQLLLYYPRVFIADPLAEWAQFGLVGVSPHELETMLDTHRQLDELASRGIVGFFSPLDREEENYYGEARLLASDASFATSVLGDLSVDDDEWERITHDGDALDDEEYTLWLLDKADIEEELSDVIGAAMTVLPALLGAARAGAQLIPLRPLERKLTLGLAYAVARRKEEATVRHLLNVEVPFLDALSAHDAVALREQEETWEAWQRRLERRVLESVAMAGDDQVLAAEILDDSLRDWCASIERASKRWPVAARVAIEGSALDLVSATVAAALAGNAVAALPSGVKALLSPAYRAMIQPRPTGADAVLMALSRTNE